MKKTRWFSVKTPPTRTGWYEGRYDFSDNFGKWYWFEDGRWKLPVGGGKLRHALFGNLWKDTEQWRGLAEKPE